MRIRGAFVQLGEETSLRNIAILAEGGGLPLYASWLAVLWEGCTVVPLSTGTPIARLGNMIANSAVKAVLVTDEEGATVGEDISAAGYNVKIVDVRLLPQHTEPPGSSHTSIASNYENTTLSKGTEAYIYYTSGSTGSPKGVSSGHEPMMNRLRWMWKQQPFCADEICCQRIDHVFIDFVAEVFGPLSRGVPIVVVPLGVRRNPALMRNFTRTFSITRITLVPTLARLLIATAAASIPTSALPISSWARSSISVGTTDLSFDESGPTKLEAVFPTVRLWVLSGEALPWSVARGLAQLSSPQAVVLNLYGSTEMAADVTFHICKFGQDGGGSELHTDLNIGQSASVPIGRPISGCGVELIEFHETEEVGTDGPPVVLRKIAPTETGRVGALYVFGAGLATGYWGRPDATKERFPIYEWDAVAASYRLRDDLFTPEPAILPTLSSGVDSEIGNGRVNREGNAVRFFRTGDLASYERNNCSGVDKGTEWTLVYRGRSDQQVKVHGRRLDLGEVDSYLMQIDGVTSGAAVALYGADLEDCDGRNEERDAGCLIGALVSPEGVDQTIVQTVCRRNLPSFAVPQAVVTTAEVPTLPGSGKIDRHRVKRMVAEAVRSGQSREFHDNSNSALVRTTSSVRANEALYNVDKMVNLIKDAVSHILQGDPLSSAEERNSAKRAEPLSAVRNRSDLFVDMGLSSMHAVRLVHELRRRLYRAGDIRTPNSVSLTDLYECQSAVLLAKRLVSAAIAGMAPGWIPAANLEREKVIALVGEESKTGACRHENVSNGDSAPVGMVNIALVTPENLSEACTHVSTTFLNSEPLLKAGYERCLSKAGPLAGAIVKRCYRHVVRRNISTVLCTGGRVLVATDDEVGRIVGFTIGNEMVKSSGGSGFQPRSGGDYCWNKSADGKYADVFNILGFDRTYESEHRQSLWQRCTNPLLSLLLRPVTNPIASVIKDLLDNYQRVRGWAYAAGEVLYISETGYRVYDHGKYVEGRLGSTQGRQAVDGVRGALVAEALERRLLEEAAGAGFIRAITICTNTVMVHVARELGFSEVSRISSIQNYHTRHRREENSRWVVAPRKPCSELPRRDGFGSPAICNRNNDRSPSASRMRRKGRRQGPFVRVAAEHESVVLFEKVLASHVPHDVFLGYAESASGIALMETASAGHWKMIPFQETAWNHRSEALAILADALPYLANSGLAVEYMEGDVEGRKAFVLLTATGTPNSGIAHPRNEPRFSPTPHGSTTWSVVGCLSWRRGVSSVLHERGTSINTTSTTLPFSEGNKNGDNSCGSVSLPCREILVLAIDRRWRYRSVGTAILRWILADSRRQRDRRVYVRSVTESVGFYERSGFHVVDSDEQPRSADGDVLLVHELT